MEKGERGFLPTPTLAVPGISKTMPPRQSHHHRQTGSEALTETETVTTTWEETNHHRQSYLLTFFFIISCSFVSISTQNKTMIFSFSLFLSLFHIQSQSNRSSLSLFQNAFCAFLFPPFSNDYFSISFFLFFFLL